MQAPKTTFSWSNYFRPTPTNLQYFASVLRGLFVVVTGTSIVMEAGIYFNLGCLVTGYILDEMIKFFGRAAHDYELIATEKTTTVTETVERKLEVNSQPDNPPSSE